MEKQTKAIFTAVATLSAVLAMGLAYYQFFAVASNDEVVDSLEGIFRKLSSIEAFFKAGGTEKLQEDEVRKALKKLDDTIQGLAQDAFKRGIKDLPIIYLKDGGISVMKNKDATFQTGTGVKTIIGVNSVTSSYATVRVDGVKQKIQSGDIVPSIRDPKCSFFVGELNSRGKPDYVVVRLVCDYDE